MTNVEGCFVAEDTQFLWIYDGIKPQLSCTEKTTDAMGQAERQGSLADRWLMSQCIATLKLIITVAVWNRLVEERYLWKI